MVLVLIFSVLIILIVIITLISNLKINIEKLEISNEIPNTPIIKEVEVSLEIYILNKIRIFKKHINKAKVQNMKNSKRMSKIKNKILKENNVKGKKQRIKFDFDIVKQLKLKLNNIDLKLELGTEDVVLTSFIICIIAIIISMLLSKIIKRYDEEKYKYKITPNYNNKNSIKFSLNSIIDIKLVNIISILFKILIRSDEIDKRTSNRRTYANSNEQYTRNDRCKYNYRGTYWNKQ